MLILPNRPWCGYRRLTEDRQGVKIGYKIQTKRSEEHVAPLGIVIGEWYEDANITAADEDVERPDYERMLADVAAGKWGGIVVWKIDRLTRLVYEYERCVRTTRKARAYIIASSTGANTKTTTGIAMLRQEVSYAEQEISNIKERVTANKQERSHDGLYHGGARRPYGFAAAKHDKRNRVTNTGKVGVKHVDHEVEILRDAAERIAWGGESYLQIITEWHAADPPIYGATGAPWTTKTLQTILTSHRMIGKQISRTEDAETGVVTETPVNAVWKPVLKKKTWEQLRRKVGHAEHKATNLRYLLGGIIFCGGCDRHLTGAARKYIKGGVETSTPTYRCRSGSADKVRGSCGKLSVIAEPVEKLVVARVLRRLASSRGFVGYMENPNDIQKRIIAADAQVDRYKQELEALSLADESGELRMTVAEMVKLRKPLLAKWDEATSELQSLQQRLAVPMPRGEDFDDLPAWYEGLKASQRQALVRAHVTRVTVLAPGRSGRFFKPERVVVLLTPAQEVGGQGQ